MIGENYKCDGQMDISEFLPECSHEYILLRTKRAKYYKCAKCGKRLRYDNYKSMRILR